MNQVTDVCVMSDGDAGYAVYYRDSLLLNGELSNQSTQWKLFSYGHDQRGAQHQADHILGQTFDILATFGEGILCGNFFGAWNAPFVYRKSL